MAHPKNLIKIIAALALMTTGSAAHAVAITLDGSTGPGAPVTYPFGPLDLGSAVVDPDGGDLDITKTFLDLSSVSFGGEFNADVAGTTVDVTESVVNGSIANNPGGFSGGDWLDYHIEIGFSLSTACISLGTACADGVSLSGLSNSAFANTAVSQTITATGGTIMIDFTGGTVATGSDFDIDFQLDVNADAGSVGFSITQYPTIDGGNTPMPEPTTLALLGLGLAGLGARRRKKA